MGPLPDEPWKSFLEDMEGKTEEELIKLELDTRPARDTAAKEGSEMLETLNALVRFGF